LNISIIIPAYNSGESLQHTLEGVSQQTLLPQEVIIIDSSSTCDVRDVCNHWQEALPIRYKKVDLAFPGHARNIGVRMSKGEWLGFLDCKTIPHAKWLETSIAKAQESESEMVTGLTEFDYGTTSFQKILWAVSYGSKAYRTLPGTIILKESFHKCGNFIANVRAGEDLEWISRAEADGLRLTTHALPLITYMGLSESFWETINKYYSYAKAAALINVRTAHKRLYLLFVLIFLTLLVTNWNAVFAGWKQSNDLYIAHISKIYLGILIVLYLSFLLIKHHKRLNRELDLFKKAYLFTVFILLSGVIYKWNDVFTGWNLVDDQYVSNITTLYLLSLTVIIFLFRGIVKPIRNSVEASYLFPWRWIAVGLVGLTLDIVKTPGYVWGAILEIKNLLVNKFKRRK